MCGRIGRCAPPPRCGLLSAGLSPKTARARPSPVSGEHSGGLEPHPDNPRREAEKELDVLVLTRQRDRLRSAVAAFCGACTLGENVCRNEGCELRPVSPLPLARRRAA